MTTQRREEPLRLVDLLAAFSLATDLGMGLPYETALRVCLLATRLARRMAVPEHQVSDVFFVALLRFVGCTSFAHEESVMFGGDDIALRHTGVYTDFADPRQVLAFFSSALPEDASVVRRAGAVAGGFLRMAKRGTTLVASHCEVAAAAARRLGLGASVQDALAQMFERWDGKGEPRKLRAEDVALSVRIIHLAQLAVLFDQTGGVDGAQQVVRSRAGGALDPGMAEAFTRHGRELLERMRGEDVWAAVVAAEPEPCSLASPPAIDGIARTMADIADLKVWFTRGHSAGVANLAEQTARQLGYTEPDLTDIRRAALLHDLGRVGVPNGIWEKPGPLTTTDWERVRLHPYHTERILARSAALAPLASLAGMHHERLDGSGYHRQASAGAIAFGARILAAADAYQALTEDRPHRRAEPPEMAARLLQTEAAHGRLDAQAVRTIVDAVGTRTRPVRRVHPAGLTEREVEVLGLLARGYSTRQIATRLVISPKTADHHIQHIYTRIGVSTRAAAALFAMEHNLLP
jgi:HD-GYP domain-containing protein (c-di-GMP phosphodiesterase class II)